MPLCHTDLTTSETYNDILHSLTRLTSTVDTVFSRVMLRVQHERSRLDSVNSRVLTACTKIDGIRRNKERATTIFSTSKHPAKTVPNHRTLFAGPDDPLAGVSPYNEGEEGVVYGVGGGKRSGVEDVEMRNEVTDLFVRLNPNNTDMVRVEIMMEEEGLSTLPEYGNGNVSSLLLFNSSKCVYKEYSGVNNLAGEEMEERDSTTERKKDMQNAPQTLLDGDLLPDVAAMDLTFKPELGGEIDVYL